MTFLQVLVKRWDPKVEDITQEGVTADTAERIKLSKMAVINFSSKQTKKIIFVVVRFEDL